MASFEYTYRCPGCRREVSSHSLILAEPHAYCPESKRKDRQGESPLVLAAIDGDDVSGKNDPQPL